MLTDSRTTSLLDRVRRYAMPDGPPACRRFDLRQTGEMRVAPDKPWIPFKAEQWFDTAGLDFHWLARARMGRFLPVVVVDSFKAGHGLLTIRLFGLVAVANAEGPEVDRGEAMRALAEIPWRPCAYAEAPYLTWSELSSETLRASFDDGRTRCYVDFAVDAEGRVLSASALDRPRSTSTGSTWSPPRTIDKEFVETPWRGTFSEYKEFGEIRVPTRAEVAWLLPERNFTYFRCQITDFRAVVQLES